MFELLIGRLGVLRLDIDWLFGGKGERDKNLVCSIPCPLIVPTRSWTVTDVSSGHSVRHGAVAVTGAGTGSSCPTQVARKALLDNFSLYQVNDPIPQWDIDSHFPLDGIRRKKPAPHPGYCYSRLRRARLGRILTKCPK